MGMIKKKTAVRGTEGGVKYVCDSCSADITSTVRIRCANTAVCPDYDLCVTCFSEAKATRDHDPRTHSYQVIEQHSIPIFKPDWGADEELLLLEGAETYGLGSWADIADHIGGYRTKDEVRDHYNDTYVDSNAFPLPEHAPPEDRTYINQIPREEFQAHRKQRIEQRKEAAKSAVPATPKQKPTASVPACHEVQGFMPGRLEFETELVFNDAEEAVQHMQFDPGDGKNPITGELEPEMELKMTVMEIYNSRLTARVERKKVLFEHQLLEYRKHVSQDKKRSKEERDLINRAKPFARMMKNDDFEKFCKGLEYEQNLRLAIHQLQEWRQVQIGDLKSGEKYETEKAQRAARPVPSTNFERLASARAPRPTAPNEPQSSMSALNASDATLKPMNGLDTPPHTGSESGDRPPANGIPNGTSTPIPSRPKFQSNPLPGSVPLKLTNENAPDLHLLSAEERKLCSDLRIMPKPYMAIKDSMFREATKQGGSLKKKAARDICKIDVNKGAKIFDFFVHNGWIAKA
ncbi:MAG: Transcriptional adapter ada2 [Bogoriella megaspora]|nr:MAG: Transcriptional adapter ada2 [Bogoriella megaspora]